MSNRKGALPSQMIGEMIEAGFICGASRNRIRPASMDLVVTDEVYRIEGSFLPHPGEAVRDIIAGNLFAAMSVLRHDFALPLERGVTYLARLSETLVLPESVYAYCNPKSTTGRNDVLTRVVADGVTRYDAATPAGFKGTLWVIIQPRSYPVLLQPGESLSQMRFFNADTRFDEIDLEISFERDGLLFRGREKTVFAYRDLKISDKDGSLILTLDLTGAMVGWECLGESRVFDFSERGYRPEDFFRPIHPKNGKVQLRAGGFYILYTRERVRVPPYLACEMVAMDARSGEFRSHYAGYIDPGWGCGQKGNGCGRRLVLELRPFEDLLMRDNQPVAKVRFERMIEEPGAHYDELDDSSYTEESSVPRLSKHFRQ